MHIPNEKEEEREILKMSTRIKGPKPPKPGLPGRSRELASPGKRDGTELRESSEMGGGQEKTCDGNTAESRKEAVCERSARRTSLDRKEK